MINNPGPGSYDPKMNPYSEKVKINIK